VQHWWTQDIGAGNTISLGLFSVRNSAAGTSYSLSIDLCSGSGNEIFPNTESVVLCDAIRVTRAFVIMAVIVLAPAAVLRMRGLRRAGGALFFVSGV
jgi:hypothetical protein